MTDPTLRKKSQELAAKGAFKELEDTVVDFYIIEEVLGIGGQAIVFKARSKTLRDNVFALKVFGLTGEPDKSTLERGLDEAKIQSKIIHPAIVRVYEPGLANVEFQGNECEILYVPMDYSSIGSCEDHPPFANNPLAIENIRSLIELLEGLEKIHESQTYHRHIKPANILQFAQMSPLRITDFGIAKEIFSLNSTATTALTPAYMAPEQLNQDDSEYMDVYSMGATFYHLLTGIEPLSEPDDINDVIAWQNIHKTQLRPNPTDLNPYCPPRLALLVMRMMAINKEERPTIRECIEELDELIASINYKSLRFPLPSELEDLFETDSYRICYTPKFNKIFSPAIHILCGTKFYVIRIHLGHPIFSQYKRLFDLLVQWYSDCFSMYETYGPHDIHIFLWSDEARIGSLGIELEREFVDSEISVYEASSQGVMHIHERDQLRGNITIVGALAVQEGIEMPGVDPNFYLLSRPFPSDEPIHGIRAFTYVNAVPKGGMTDPHTLRSAVIQNVRDAMEKLYELNDDDHEYTGAKMGKIRKRFPRLSIIILDSHETSHPVAVINYVASKYKYIHEVATEIIERGAKAVKTSTFLETGRAIIQSDKILF